MDKKIVDKIVTEGNTISVKHKQSNVDHPFYYNLHRSGIECIEIVKHMNFCVGSAMKYLWRAGLKNNSIDSIEKEIEDCEKAIWYINKHIEMIKK